jgi:hypothetical protein
LTYDCKKINFRREEVEKDERFLIVSNTLAYPNTTPKKVSLHWAQMKDLFPIGKLVKDYMLPYKSPLEGVLHPAAANSNSQPNTQILR